MVYDSPMVIQYAAFVLLCLAVLFLLWAPWKSALRQRRREAWPRVTGKVLEQRMTRDGAYVTLDYRAEYTHAGRAFDGVCRDWRPGSYAVPEPGEQNSERLMRERLDLFKVGDPIELLVNPANPAEAYYKRGRTWPLLAAAIAATVLLLALVAMLAPVILTRP